jgi:hypothetical protein
MSFESILGWSLILTLLAALSAGLVIPPLLYIEKSFLPVVFARPVRIIGIALGTLILWYALPLLVHFIYLRF